MRIDPLPDPNNKINSVNVDSLSLLNGQAMVLPNDAEDNLTKLLLYEIVRVKQLIQQSEPASGNNNHVSITILTELISEAYDSLVNYDLVLMKKYYDLLQNCD